MNAYPFHFYLYKGKKSDLYVELQEMLQPDSQQRFAIWEPKDCTKQYLLIVVFGMPLATSYCLQREIWKSDEIVFNSYFNSNRSKFMIYGRDDIPELYSSGEYKNGISESGDLTI